jgi:hypothetical protein
MASRECPICGKTIRLENIERHYENVHPGKAVPVALLKEEQRAIRESRRTSAPGLRNSGRPPYVLVAIVLVIVVAGLAGAVYVVSGPGKSGTPNADVVTYCGGEGTVQHYHPLLVINLNGVQQHLPYDSTQSADVGFINVAGFTNPAFFCSPGEIHALHTHDGSGIIHVELPGAITQTPALGDFFRIWGEPLLPTQVWTFSGTLRATMIDADTGHSADYSVNPQSIPLYAPAGGPNANVYPIPPSLILNGQFGNGASSGMYSGELIYLNITR